MEYRYDAESEELDAGNEQSSGALDARNGALQATGTGVVRNGFVESELQSLSRDGVINDGSYNHSTSQRLPPRSTQGSNVVMAALVIGNLLLFMCISCTVSFLPSVAAQKAPSTVHGAAVSTAVGFIFSITTVTEFIVSPIIGRDLPNVGTKIPILLGLLTVGCCAVLFSFVGSVQTWPAFLGLSYAIRAVQGIGTGAVFASSFALVAGTFPDKVASMFGILECSSSIGFVLGPPAGGLLFDHGGFRAPFLTFGSLILLGVAVMAFVLPSPPPAPREKTLGITTLLRVPHVVLQLITIFLANASVGYFDANLSPFLKSHFHLSSTFVSLVFIVPFLSYSVVAPLAGRLGERVGVRILIPAALFLDGVGFILLGPTSALRIHPQLWITCVSLVLIGIAAAVGIVLSPADILETMKSKGHLDSIELHGTIGGLAGAATSLGIGAGPTVGGLFSGLIGFRESSAVFGLIMFAHAGLLTLVGFCWWWKQKNAILAGSRAAQRAVSPVTAAAVRPGLRARLSATLGGLLVSSHSPHGATVWYPHTLPDR